MVIFLIFTIALLLNLALGVYHFVHQRKLTHSSSDTEALTSHRRPYRISGTVWAVLFLLLHLFLTVWAARSWIESDLHWVLEINVVLIVSVQVLLRLPLLCAYLNRTEKFSKILAHPLIITIALLLLASCLSKFALEFPTNMDNLTAFGHKIEHILIALGVFGLFFLFQRRGSAPSVLALVLAVIGIVEYFVIQFKAMPLQPGDLLAISTAATVAESFTFDLSGVCLFGISLGVLAIVCCMLAGVLNAARQSSEEQPASSTPSLKRVSRMRRQLVGNLATGFVCLVVLVGNVFVVDYYNTLDIKVGTWDPLGSYRQYGFLTSFIASAQTIVPIQPDNYDSDEAASLLEAYAAQYDSNESTGASEERAAAVAQFEEEQPTVIVIMNETFADLSIYENLHADYEGPEFYNSISDALVKGTLYVSSFAGATCNTEFEFLTGNTMAFIGTGVYPYVAYNLTETENLAAQFKELGYTTTAIHPNKATNWNREIVYEDLGFDEFFDIDYFEDADRLREHVTDEAIYDSILELLENDDDPQFIFGVTMQNHASYTTGLVPEDLQTHYVIDGEEDAETNEYLSVIQEADRMLEEFLAQLEELDREVVVVFFGDHQPSVASKYSEWVGDGSQTFDEMKWQTPYMIWANYDVAGNSQTSEQKDISANYLGTLLMEVIGAPLTDYQKAQLSLSEALPVICSAGYKDSTGTWYLDGSASGKDTSLAETDDQAEAIQALLDFSMIQYYKLFDHDGSVYALRRQSAANW